MKMTAVINLENLDSLDTVYYIDLQCAVSS